MKKFIDKNSRNYILNILNAKQIDDEIFKYANLMDVDLIRLFYEKIVCVKSKEELEKNKEVLVSTLLGVCGNYLASQKFIKEGLKVENEYPVLDKNKKETTKADVAYYKNNKLYLYEVKTTLQIIDNIRNYKEDNEKLYKGKVFYDKDEEIIKYKEIGIKLINQITKLKSKSDNVGIIVFEDCYIDQIMIDKIKKIGVKVIMIPISINKLKMTIEQIIEDIIDKITIDLKRKKILEKISQ